MIQVPLEPIKVLEIFNSISGEVSPYHQGCPTTFIRIAGCNLHCSYCDTPTAHDKGDSWLYTKIMPALVKLYSQTGRLCITGGEPLLQMNGVKNLVRMFNNSWIETNGTIDFSSIKAEIVADYKIDNMENIPYYFYSLSASSFIKFVVESKHQFLDCVKIQRSLQLGGCKAIFAYSPVNKELTETSVQDVSAISLLSWMKDALLPNTIINIQMHKYLGLK